MSMPDETLHSRVTRYHLLSGNRTERQTFKDLFGAQPFAIKIIPKQIEDLAEKLPGDKNDNLNELLACNTILPAYKPFLGIPKINQDGNSTSLVSRLPRREVSFHSMAKICLSCVQSDLIETGHSYWHRSHHIPGVTACWRHGESLLQACPTCTHPFYRDNKLLPMLTNPCVCGWKPLGSHSPSVVPGIEQKFAHFAKQLLDSDLPAVSSGVLAACYRRQAKKNGFAHGNLMSTAKMFESIQSKFGHDFLSRIDNAYASGKYHQWIRTTTVNDQLDMPITRHLIISLHLFGNVNVFEKRIAEEIILFTGTPTRKSSNKISTGSNKAIHRLKVNNIIEARPGTTLDYLWKHAYQATLWLTANDKNWLSGVLLKKTNASLTKESNIHEFDGKYADIIKNGVKALYNISQTQTRANLGNMLALLPKKIAGVPQRNNLFPMVSEQLEINFESVWHFRLRRIISALSEMHRLKLPPNTTSLQLCSSLPVPAWSALISYFEWDVEKMVSEGIDVEKELAKANVPRQWDGPPGYQKSLGGRAYSKQKS